jgi:hypothetical protein
MGTLEHAVKRDMNSWGNSFVSHRKFIVNALYHSIFELCFVQFLSFVSASRAQRKQAMLLAFQQVHFKEQMPASLT